jgi:F0F1-type ATP synthase membrane subunit c/vacuolar-type H+-ATPase subunit K
VYDAGDAHTIETTVKASEDTMSGLAKDLPSLGSAINTALAAPGKAWSTAGLSKSLIPEIGLPKGGAKEEYKLPNKGLGPDEKRGVYILAGIVGLGFLVGGSGKGKVAEKAEHAVKSERGVKGDARWAKASGAGIVGHGVRKD